MKRILTTMCALTLLLAASVPALAVEPEQSASYYPTSVEEYMEGDSPRIKKVYQLSLADDPSQIPTEDFERDGRLYYCSLGRVSHKTPCPDFLTFRVLT